MNQVKRHVRTVQTRKPSRDPRLQWGEEFAGSSTALRQCTTNREFSFQIATDQYQRKQAHRASLKWAQYFLMLTAKATIRWPRTHIEEFAHRNKTGMKLTHAMLHEAASNYMGWNKTQISLLGVKWPLEKGWLSSLIGREVSEETWNRVLAFRGMKPKERKRVMRLEKQGEMNL